jgi:hypothetical protein
VAGKDENYEVSTLLITSDSVEPAIGTGEKVDSEEGLKRGRACHEEA